MEASTPGKTAAKLRACQTAADSGMAGTLTSFDDRFLENKKSSLSNLGLAFFPAGKKGGMIMRLKLSPFEGTGLFSASADKPSHRDNRKPGHFAAPSVAPVHGLRHFLRLHARSAGYAAFVAMVLVCIAAAATVASNDHLPLILGSL